MVGLIGSRVKRFNLALTLIKKRFWLIFKLLKMSLKKVWILDHFRVRDFIKNHLVQIFIHKFFWFYRIYLILKRTILFLFYVSSQNFEVHLFGLHRRNFYFGNKTRFCGIFFSTSDCRSWFFHNCVATLSHDHIGIILWLQTRHICVRMNIALNLSEVAILFLCCTWEPHYFLMLILFDIFIITMKLGRMILLFNWRNRLLFYFSDAFCIG